MNIKEANAKFRKPNHKQTVIATAKGWVVEATGEVLVSLKGLDAKINQLINGASETFVHTVDEVVDKVEDVIDELLNSIDETEKDEKDSEVQEKTEDSKEEVSDETKEPDQSTDEEESTPPEDVNEDAVEKEETPPVIAPPVTDAPKRRGRPPKVVQPVETDK